MPTATKQPKRTRKPTGRKNGSRPRAVAEFPPGSIEAKLSAIGQSVPAREWAKLPADYFANLDHYRYGSPKRK
jgi:hypothetical protein